MRRGVGRAITAAAAAAVIVLAGCGGSRTSGGEPVTFTAGSLDGGTASTADLRGKPLLLTSWATWCAACREELPRMERLYEQDRRRGLQMVAVNVNASGVDFRARRMISSLGLTMPVWSDPDDRFSVQFRAVGVPTSVLLDRNGRAVRIWQGGFDPANQADAQVVEQALGRTT